MDLVELTRILRAPGSLWVRRQDRCSGCGDPPVWLAVRFSNGELSSDWLCEDCADPAWRPAGFKLLTDPTLLTALPVGDPETCSTRPAGPEGPLCGAPEEYLAVYLCGTPDGKIRTGRSCASCMADLELAPGRVVALPLGLA